MKPVAPVMKTVDFAIVAGLACGINFYKSVLDVMKER
jgi:hypothetical protein